MKVISINIGEVVVDDSVIDAGFPGVYIRVLKEGKINKGDEMVLLKRREENLFIRDIYGVVKRYS